MTEARRAILVGVGLADPGLEAEATDLMVDAARRAGADARAPALLGALDRIAVPQGTWTYPDPARLVASGIGAARARTHFGELGVSQQTLISEALRAIEQGESSVALVVGGEAREWSRTASAAGLATETPQPGVVPDVVHRREPEFIAQAEIDAGLLMPVEQYALIENALCAHEGTPPLLRQDAISELWARFNLVATKNPHAAFAEFQTPEQLAVPSAQNRPLAFPYNKWHASQWTVNQAAALLFCSEEAAREHGVPLDRWVFPLVGIDANHSVSLSRRRDLFRWPAMHVLGRAAQKRIGRPLAEVEFKEVYSCFPSAVRVQQRELSLDRSETPTLTGGMAFAGGPFNNFVYQATAAMVANLREHPGSLGMVTTVCGLLTKPGLAIWCASPDGQAALLDDLATEAAAEAQPLEVETGYRGPARVATSTVTYEGLDPVRVAVIADIDAQRRCVAAVRDPELARRVLVEEFQGTSIGVASATFSV
jgi:acetyl-CoA C-acetyltransferase